MDWLWAQSAAGRVALDPEIGNIRHLSFETGGRTIAPLHTAPWADDPAVAVNDSVPPVEKRLAGDFFCAPFGAADVDGAPPHGWTANSAWTLEDRQEASLRLELRKKVLGATITKRLHLASDAPLLYQSHEISGGEGRLTVAHHPMIRLEQRGTLSTSAKSAAISPATPLEPGRNRLACGQRSTDLSRFPAEGGGTVDLLALPIGDRHEDFVTLIEAPGADLGWTAVLREAEDDIVFVLKSPSVLPVTMLWHSNGGRDYAPWSGRHSGVIGIEDGCAAGSAGHKAALGPNPIAQEGVATAITLGPTIRVAHVIGAVPRPTGWARVTGIATGTDSLTLTDVSGGAITLPFDTGFLT